VVRKINDFESISRRISETVRDMVEVAINHDLSIDIKIDVLERP